MFFCSGKSSLLYMFFRWYCWLDFIPYLLVSVSFSLVVSSLLWVWNRIDLAPLKRGGCPLKNKALLYYYFGSAIWSEYFLVWILLCQLSEEGPCEDISSDGQSSSFNEWILPAKEFDGMWERLLLFVIYAFPVLILYCLFLWLTIKF